MKVVVISPTYNEKVNMERMIPILEEKVFPKIKNHDMFLLVADDNSPDGTADVVKKYKKQWKNIVLLEGEKKGLGAAYVKAMRYASKEMKADAVIEFDADFQHDPYDIPRLVEAMDKGYDYVIGSRYVKGGKIPAEWGIHRKFMSFFGSLFARIVLFTPFINDMTSGFKLTKTAFLDRVDLENLYSKYYAYKIQILYEVVKKGAKVKEVPIIFYERKEGSSKISQKDLFDSFLVVLKLRVRDSKKFVKFLVVGGTGFLINTVIYTTLAHHTDINLVLANTIGAEMAIFSNFNLNNVWTFGKRKEHKFNGYFRKMGMFFATSNIGVWLFQNGAIALGSALYGRTHYLIYFLIGTSILLVWNFTIYSKFIWREKAAII